MLGQDTSLHASRERLEIEVKLWDKYEGEEVYYSLKFRDKAGGFGGVTIFLSPEQVVQIHDTLAQELTAVAQKVQVPA